jgi:ATP-dependent helicase/nuclease subunit A
MIDLVDSHQRQEALEPSKSFIVQAPAGSGKTELLIQRYLRMLGLVNSPEEVLAITFTRKAATEMRSRIINALEEVFCGHPPADAAAEITHGLAASVMQQDKANNWQLFDNPGRLRIQTIDSLTASLTRQMPILARFGAQPETLEDARELYQLAAVNTLAELEADEHWSEAIAVLLKHLDNDLPRVRNMLASMLARRDQWLRHIVKQHQREELEDGLRHLVEEELGRALRNIPGQLEDELLTLLRYAAGNLHADKSDSPIVTCLDIHHLPGKSAEDLEKLRAITTFLFTQSDSWRKAANVKLGFPAASSNKAESETRKSMKTRFAALIVNLSDVKNLTEHLTEVKYLPAVTYTEAEWEVVDALYQLLVLADAQLRLLFAERNQMDFTGITQAAIQSLGDADSPTDLALQLDYQIKHVLVDEFQDISINQYTLLEKLTAGWSEGDEHSLFLVGDPMQSIYRFREAEVGLFLNTWEQKRLNQVSLTPLNISVNFRSDPGIVEWVNQTFQKVLPEQADISRGAVSFVKANPYHAPEVENPVKVHPLLSRDDTKESEKVLAIVRTEKQENLNSSIAILVRNRSHLKEIVLRFRENKVTYRAVEIDNMGQRPAIQDLLALTLALTHLADRISWFAVLRAPWCGMRLQDLDRLFANNKNICLWTTLKEKTQMESLDDEIKMRLQGLVDIFTTAFEEQGRRSLSRWVESVWMRIGGPASLQYESDLSNCQTFFELLSEFDDGGDIKDRQAFIEKVGTLYATADSNSDNAVQIMTIHKSKGLEFDCVILPGLSRGSGLDEVSLLRWMEKPHGSHQDLLLAPVKESGKENSLIFNYLGRLEKEKQTFELGRLLYVAATRAKKNLHLIATAEVSNSEQGYSLLSPRKNSLLMQLWPVVSTFMQESLVDYIPEPEAEESEPSRKNLSLRRLKYEWRLPLAPDSVTWDSLENYEPDQKEDSLIEYEWAGEAIKHVGTVVHRCLQIIAEQGLGFWDEQSISNLQQSNRVLLTRLGVSEKELDHANGQIHLALSNIIADTRGQWILSEQHIDAKNEYALSGIYQGKVTNVVIDRTFIDADGVRWIVDYKTSRHEDEDIEAFLDQQQERYQQQLEKYGTLFKEMEDKPVKLALYFPLLQGWREWSLS